MKYSKHIEKVKDKKNKTSIIVNEIYVGTKTLKEKILDSMIRSVEQGQKNIGKE